jgi:hypothetical protein
MTLFSSCVDTRFRGRGFLLFGAMVVASLASLSAHFVRGLSSPGSAAAFVSSPTGAIDAPIHLSWSAGSTTVDTGLSVACFYVANSSSPRLDSPDWTRITGVGFELPGSAAGFTLLSPSGSDWQLVENVQTSLAGTEVTLDFAIMAGVNPTGRAPGRPQDPLGIPPGQAEVRRSGTEFCVSGPFPPDLSIERIINGVVVQFHGLDASPQAELGVWYPTPQGTVGPGPVPRPIPLY